MNPISLKNRDMEPIENKTAELLNHKIYMVYKVWLRPYLKKDIHLMGFYIKLMYNPVYGPPS